MSTRFVTVTEFKAKCLGLIDEVAAKGESITVTRRGHPVAVLGPAKKKRRKSSMGILAGKVKIVGDMVNTADLWRGFGEETDPLFRVLPLTDQVASEFAALAILKDPGDRAIVATARVHGLRLLTSDQRIIDSNLVPVIE